ncbi:hypothetical protein [Pseudonocardia sp. C8]|uniref:hypothetical protein n=1 Tax=Pseudonocardia sp. C8 TaxID=2762759 RepID=UPI001C93036A|nr:hypothetical protein [Pseudonocardia sp. C8]
MSPCRAGRPARPPVAAGATLGAFALFMLYFTRYSRHHLVAAAPDEEFAALAAAEEELT